MIRDRIIQERTRRGWTQQQLAERAGVPRTTVAHYERGARDPRVSNLARIARALGTTLDNLVRPR